MQPVIQLTSKLPLVVTPSFQKTSQEHADLINEKKAHKYHRKVNPEGHESGRNAIIAALSKSEVPNWNLKFNALK